MTNGSLVFLAIAAVLGVWSVLLVTRRPRIGVALGVGGWALEASFREAEVRRGVEDAVGPGVFLGSMRIGLMDVIAVVLFAAAVFVILAPPADGRKRRTPLMPKSFALSLLGLIVLFFFTLVQGVREFGPQPAFNSGREFFYVISFIAFAATHGRRLRREQVEVIWFVVAGALTTMALFFIAQNGFGGVGTANGRALNSNQAVLVANAALLAVVRPRPRPFHIALGGLFSIVLVASQQRTVWASMIFALGVAGVFLLGRQGRLSRKWARLSVVFGAALMTLAVLSLPDLSANLSRSADVSRSIDRGNAGWRIENAESILRLYADRPLHEQLIGPPSGIGLERTVGDSTQTVTVGAHNTYLFMLVAVGLVGLVLLGIMYWSLMAKAWRSPNVSYLLPLVASQLVFSIGYQITPDQGFLLGFFAAGALVVNGRREASDLRAQSSDVPSSAPRVVTTAG